jgi:adenosylhomocysteine nucleosidase
LTTAILSALADEQRGLIEQLKHPVKMVRAGRDFWCGELHGHPVVLALSKIGKVAAATTATTLIEAFKAQRIVFTGVAGGLGAGVKVGDVVVATEFFQHDMDASPLFPRYEIPLYGRTLFPCDPQLSALLLEAAQASCTGSKGLFNGYNAEANSAVHSGLLASGDRFVSGAQESLALQNVLHAQGLVPLAVEMEGAAVAQVCWDYGIPFAAVRTISDRADDQAHVDFPSFVMEVASVYALTIVNELMRLLPKK